MVIEDRIQKGIHPGFGMQAYHEWKLNKEDLKAGPISCSMLKQFALNPYAWRWSPEITTTAAMQTGSLFDAAVTDPERIGEIVAVSAFDNYRTKEAQLWKQCCLDAGLVICKQEELDHALKAAKEVRKHPIAKEILKGCETQVAVIGEIGDIPAKALLDILPSATGKWGDSIVDYKTTSNGLDDEALRRTMGQYKYHWQAAFYRTLLNSVSDTRYCERFVFIFQDITTLEVRVVELHNDAMALGVRAVAQAVKDFVKCAHEGISSRYTGKCAKLDLLPYVAMNEDDWLNSLVEW